MLTEDQIQILDDAILVLVDMGEHATAERLCRRLAAGMGLHYPTAWSCKDNTSNIVYIPCSNRNLAADLAPGPAHPH